MQHKNLNHDEALKLKANLDMKVEILSHGINLTDSLFDRFSKPHPFITKRRGYGNQDPLEMRSKIIPQEIYIGSPLIVGAVNVRYDSPWELTFENNEFLLKNTEYLRSVNVSFPLRPKFYDLQISSGQNVNQIITLYGGKSLAIFVYGTCSLVAQKKPCHYCSIDPNRTKPNDFETVVKPGQLEEALTIALENSPEEVNQVMINGGNFPDLDKSFSYYCELAQVADKVIKRLNKKVELHLIVFPPSNLSLFDKLRDTNVCVSMNTEVYDPTLFKKYCPGKTDTLGQTNLFKALDKAVDILGKGRVYSILVGG